MTEATARQDERRRHPRSEVVATAVVLATNKYAGHYLVENLSAGGALLVGDAELEPGERLKMLLQLPGRKPISLSAEVVRRQVNDAQECLFAVAFRHLSAGIEDTIQQVVLATLERLHDASQPEVLVVDDSREVGTHRLSPVALCAAFPRSDYSGDSAPRPGPRWTGQFAGARYAGARIKGRQDDVCRAEGIDPDAVPYGVTVCVVDLADVTGEDGDYEWHVRNPRRVEPVPVTGYAAVYNVDDELIHYVDGRHDEAPAVEAPVQPETPRPKRRRARGPAAEKVFPLGLVCEKGLIYYIKRGAVWAVPKKKPGKPKGKPRMITDAGIQQDDRFLYFLDQDGDISRTPKELVPELFDEDDEPPDRLQSEQETDDADSETDEDEAKPFLEQSEEEQEESVWEYLLGRGPLRKEEAIRIAAAALGADLPDQAGAKEGSPIWCGVDAAIARAVRHERFDRPARMKVRAVSPALDTYTSRLWQMCVLGAISEAPIDEEAAVIVVAYWAREMVGLDMQRFRSDGKVAGAIREVIKAALDANLLERVGRYRLRRTAAGLEALIEEFAEDAASASELESASPAEVSSDEDLADGDSDGEGEKPAVDEPEADATPTSPVMRVVEEPRELSEDEQLLVIQLPESFDDNDAGWMVERHLAISIATLLPHFADKKAPGKIWPIFLASGRPHVQDLSLWVGVPRGMPQDFVDVLRKGLEEQGAKSSIELDVVHGNGFRPLMVWTDEGLEVPLGNDCCLDDAALAAFDDISAIIRRPLTFARRSKAAKGAQLTELLFGDPDEVAKKYATDLGRKLLQETKSGARFRFTLLALHQLVKFPDDSMTASGLLTLDCPYGVALAFDSERIRQLLALMPEDVTFKRLRRPTDEQVLDLDAPLPVGMVARLGEPQEDEKGPVVPFIVEEFVKAEERAELRSLDDGIGA
ncbi:MAG: PilZ domain-containing protein [Deltaproteobacteria bacterium]|nr:PilZ domain-containing protein [Deltaproteobacteria bacterium]